MKNIRKSICFLIAWLLLLSIVSACKSPADTGKPSDIGTSGSTNGATEDGTVDTSPALDENGYEKDSIPESTNFEDYTFNILSWAENNDYLFPEKPNDNDIISFDIYMRNKQIEESFHCILKPEIVPGAWAKEEDRAFLAKARMAGAYNYDLIASYSLWPTVLAQEDLLANLLTLNYPEVTKPWWSTCAEAYTYNEALYYLTCPSSRGSIMNAEVMFANTRLLDTYLLDEDVFSLVLENEWTYSKFLEITEIFKGLANDESEANRIYALTVDDESRMDAFYYGAGFHSVVRNTDGSMSLGFASRNELEKISDYADSLSKLFQDNNGFVVYPDDNISDMIAGRSVFTVAALVNISRLPDDSSYAPIPLPKYNQEDTRYYSCQTNAYDVWCIPKTTAKAEEAGIIVEAMASSDYRSIFPKFYESKLKLKYSDDLVGYQIFDIIRDSIITDFGRLEQLSLNDCGIEGIWRRVFEPGSRYYGSFMSSYNNMNGDGQLEVALEKLLAKYRNENL